MRDMAMDEFFWMSILRADADARRLEMEGLADRENSPDEEKPGFWRRFVAEFKRAFNCRGADTGVRFGSEHGIECGARMLKGDVV